jgi:hypothetical protein
MFIPDPNFFHPGSLIRIKEFKYFNPKYGFYALGNMIRVVPTGSRIWIPDPNPDFLPIPDPGAKKAPDPGSRSATLHCIMDHHSPVLS